jgi:hypothetical protein
VTATIRVLNAPPTAVLTVGVPGQSFRERDVVLASFSTPTDPSAADRAGLRYSFSTDSEKLAASYAEAGASPTSAPIVLSDDGVQVVYGRVFDKDVGFTNVIATIQVAGAVPVATLSGGGTTTEGTPVTIGFSTPQDPSPADTDAGLRYSFALARADLSSSYAQASANYWSDLRIGESGLQVVYGRIFDKDGGYTDSTTTVVVKKAAALAVSGSGVYGGGATLSAVLTGDGSPLAGKLVSFHLMKGGSTSSSVRPRPMPPGWRPSRTWTWRGSERGLPRVSSRRASRPMTRTGPPPRPATCSSPLAR